MGKYTILLVDDEEVVLQVIMKKIKWEDLGFEVVGYANNGVKAFEMVEDLQPDVVMTDIRMPYMDGIELSKKIKAELPATKILIFTGFDEFEYAKEAIHLEVEDYVLKPINAKELTEVFAQMKTKIDQEISDRKNVEILQKYYLDSLPLLQLNFYSALIKGTVVKEDIDKKLSNYQISLFGPLFCCFVIYTSKHNIPDGMNPLILTTAVKKQASDYFEHKWDIKNFSYDGNTVLIVELKEEKEILNLTDECDRFCRYIQRIIGATITIGIGQICKDIYEIAKSYRSARDAVSYRVLYGSCRAINIKEIVPQDKLEGDTDCGIKLLKLYKAIRMNSQEDIVKAVEQYTNNVLIPSKTMQQYGIEIMELIGGFYRFVHSNEIVMDEFKVDIRTIYEKLLELDIGELSEWLINISIKLQNKFINVRSCSTKSYVAKAKSYVQDNFGDEDVSLDTICNLLGVSNSYFSSIFKKETGKSFIAYLTNFRMEQAAEWLIKTPEKSYLIAKKVGYSDPNYFSYVFKRKYGASPSQYRTEYTESEK